MTGNDYVSNFPLDLALGKQVNSPPANLFGPFIMTITRDRYGDSHRNLGQPSHAVIDSRPVAFNTDAHCETHCINLHLFEGSFSQ